jgi:uncharacterized membrane protein
MILKKLLIAIFAGFILCLVTVMMPSCTHDPVGLELIKDTVCFDTQVMTILTNSCYCHNNGSTEGFNMANHTDVMDYVTAGNPRKSKLYQVITAINGVNMMPPAPGPPVSQENRILIEVWIAQGAPNKICTQDTTVAGVR